MSHCRNPEWHAQQRARGICYICRRPMLDSDPRQAHLECMRLRNQGYVVAEIRKNPPILGEGGTNGPRQDPRG